MNKSRRSRLSDLQTRIEEIMTDLGEIRNEEQAAYESMPESIQYSERGDTMADAIDNMDEAVSLLEDIDSYLEEAKGN